MKCINKEQYENETSELTEEFNGNRACNCNSMIPSFICGNGIHAFTKQECHMCGEASYWKENI